MSAKILVVDDERSIAEILKYNLEKEGFEVILAYDGEEALERLEQDKPDLILLDIMLPKKDGFAVCREIRAQKEIPIIMLTARETEVDKVLGLELGADDYVTKPFSAREVGPGKGDSQADPGCRKEKKLLRRGSVVDLDAIQVFAESGPWADP